MPNYYRSNAVYDKIIRDGLVPPYFFQVGNSWDLIYGDQNAIPRLLVIAEGVARGELLNIRTPEQNNSWILLNILSELTGVPIINIRFDISQDEITHVIKIDDNLSEISLPDLSSLYQEYGLPINSGLSTKAINDASSSAYHNWQRTSLGRNIIVTDIDLLKHDNNGRILRADELKRSYIPVQDWRPYPADFPNFRLMWNLFHNANIEFNIVYNRRQKTPLFDDPENLAIFHVNFADEPPINLVRLCTFEEYIH